MQEFKNRLLEFIYDRYNTSVRKFEEMCGLTNGTIASIKVKGPSADIVSKISDTCPELNLNWLFTGEGDMYKATESEAKPSLERPIPLLPFEAIAGPGDPVYEDEREFEYYSVPAFRNSDFLFRVKGDSMTPKFTGGDLVACKKIEIDRSYFIQWNRVYVVYTQSQGVMIKRLQPSEHEDCIKCVSDNEKYAPFDVPKSDIVALALVNGSISLE